MSCGTTVANALKGVEGVEKSEASFENSNAQVWFSTTPVKVASLIQAVEDMGFGAEFDKELTPPNITLNVKGMKCQV
jgi:copper chaperone CopZ